MQGFNTTNYGLLQGLLLDDPKPSKKAMIALLRGQSALEPQPELPSFKHRPLEQEVPSAPGASPGVTGSWDAPEQPPQRQGGPVLKQALAQARAAQAQQPQIPQPPQGPQMDDFGTRDADLQRQHADAMAAMQQQMQPPDTKGAQEAYEKRAQGGNMQMMLALAAQRAGEGYQGVQGHYLKQAASAREPIKTAAGTMTETGFIEDPSFGQAQKVRAAEARVAAIERAQASNISAAERRRLEADKQQAAADLRQATLGLQAQIANQASADRRYGIEQAHLDRQAALDAKGGGGGKILPAKTIADMTADEQKAAQFGNLSKEFKTEYAGAEGTAMKLVGNVGGLVGADTGASEWWRNYKKEAELVERHGMFGASLTEGEKAAWREADISPTMAPAAIQRNLQRRAQILVDKHRMAVSRLGASGYNVEGFPLPPQTAPQAPTAPHGGGASGSWDAPAANGLPAGWSVKTR